MAEDDKEKKKKKRRGKVTVTGTPQMSGEVVSDEEGPSLPSAERMRELAKEKPPKGFKQVR